MPPISGLDVSSEFRIMFALHKHDEGADVGVNLWTADPQCLVNEPPASCAKPLYAGSLFIADPAQWAEAKAIDDACPDGITITGSQIGTTNEDPPGTPAPNRINTKPGETNTFYAYPSYPTAPTFAGLIQASFHVANWGSVAASDAAWDPIPNGGVVQNGVAPPQFPPVSASAEDLWL